jgi:signal transduction histidine kinase
MPRNTNSIIKHSWPNLSSLLAMYGLFAAVILRALIDGAYNELPPIYPGLEISFLILFSLIIAWPDQSRALLYVYFTVQSGIIIALLSIWPEYDFVNLLFVLLSYQSATLFKDRSRWVMLGIIVFLTASSLMVFFGAARGLSLALLNMAGEIVITAYTVTNQELEKTRANSKILLTRMKATHQQLVTYSTQVEELTTIEQRNQLARELHDSVSQVIFSIILNTRSAQLMYQKKSPQLKNQLELLQNLTHDALAMIRTIIAQLLPIRK